MMGVILFVFSTFVLLAGAGVLVFMLVEEERFINNLIDKEGDDDV